MVTGCCNVRACAVPDESHRSGVAAQDLRESRAGGYEGARDDIQARVPRSATRILELGCLTGVLGAALKERNGAVVLGVELDPIYARGAAMRLDRVVVADAEEFLRGPPPAEAPLDLLDRGRRARASR